MGFSSTSQVDDVIVQTRPFYPNLSTKKMAEVTRLDGAVTTERLKSALSFASLKVERELKKWVVLQPHFNTLIDYDTAQKTDKCTLYELAVFNEARAMLTESYRDFDSTKTTETRSEDLTSQVDDYRRNVRHAITMFFDDGSDDDTDSGFMTVELI